jgi:hypothetical protein
MMVTLLCGVNGDDFMAGERSARVKALYYGLDEGKKNVFCIRDESQTNV